MAAGTMKTRTISGLLILLGICAALTLPFFITHDDFRQNDKPNVSEEHVSVESGLESIILDGTVLIDIPKGYSIPDDEYIANGAECGVAAVVIKDRDENSITVQGWTSADPKNPHVLPSVSDFEVPPSIVPTESGRAFQIKAKDSNGDITGYSTYTRVGDITYEVKIEPCNKGGDGTLSAEAIRDYCDFISSIEEYSPKENCPTCG